MLIVCLFFSQLTYGSTGDISKEIIEIIHPTIVVAPVPAQFSSIALIDADERIRRLEKITKDLEKRVESLERKVEEVDNNKYSKTN